MKFLPRPIAATERMECDLPLDCTYKVICCSDLSPCVIALTREQYRLDAVDGLSLHEDYITNVKGTVNAFYGVLRFN